MFGFLKQVFGEFSQDRGGQMAAAFAYVAVFSIGPLLLVLISIIGFIYGQKAAQGQLYGHLTSVVGPDTAKNLQSVIAHSHQGGTGVVALIIGVIGTLLAAGGLTTQLQNSFDTVFGAIPDPKSGIKRTIYTKIKNISLLIVASLTIAASVIVSALINGLGDRVNQEIGLPPFVLELINTLASLLVFVAVLYLIYRVLPDVKIPAKTAFFAALAVSLLFTIGKIILAIIIGRNGTAGAYGAAASVIVLLLWFYYTAQILLLGAEGVKVHGLRSKTTYKPKRYTLGRKSLDINVKNDFRGRLLEAFSRGYRSRK